MRLRTRSTGAQRQAITSMLSSVGWAQAFGFTATSIAVGWGVVLAITLVRLIVRPLLSITLAMRLIADGKLDTFIPGANRHDEIGAMAKAIAVFRDGLLRVRVYDADREKERAAKQRSIELLVGANQSFEHEAGTLTSTLSDAAAQMAKAARSLLAISAKTNERSAAVTTAAQDASENVRLVATSTDEMATSISEIARQVTISQEMAMHAVARAADADVSVRALVAGAQRIGDVVGLIHKIARETDLLALNATIEAARAGEAGRGFSVVAAEVKQLAVATGRATEEVKRQVGQIQKTMELAAGVIEEIRQAIQRMDGNTAHIASAVEEQTAAVRLITASAKRAANNTEGVTTNILDVRSGSASTDAAAREVLKAAEVVAARADSMTLSVTNFLSKAQAA